MKYDSTFHYEPGTYNVQCERCGRAVKRYMAVFDGQYPGMLVCTECYDPKHPFELPRKTRPDNMSVRDARPRKEQGEMQDYTIPANMTWDTCPWLWGETGIIEWG